MGLCNKVSEICTAFVFSAVLLCFVELCVGVLRGRCFGTCYHLGARLFSELSDVASGPRLKVQI